MGTRYGIKNVLEFIPAFVSGDAFEALQNKWDAMASAVIALQVFAELVLHVVLWSLLFVNTQNVYSAFLATYSDEKYAAVWLNVYEPISTSSCPSDPSGAFVFSAPPSPSPAMSSCVESRDDDDLSPWSLQKDPYHVYSLNDASQATVRQVAVDTLYHCMIAATITFWVWIAVRVSLNGLMICLDWVNSTATNTSNDEKNIYYLLKRATTPGVVKTVVMSSIDAVILSLLLLFVDLCVHPGYDKFESTDGRMHRYAYVSESESSPWHIVHSMRWTLLCALGLRTLLKKNLFCQSSELYANAMLAMATAEAAKEAAAAAAAKEAAAAAAAAAPEDAGRYLTRTEDARPETTALLGRLRAYRGAESFRGFGPSPPLVFT